MNAALALYESHNLSLIPIARPDQCPKDDPSAGKKPTIKWQPYQKRRPTRAELTTWFDRQHQNFGIVTGTISGVVVVDCDSKEAVDYWQAHYPETPWRTKTGKGFHFFYRQPRSPVSNQARIQTADGRLAIDVRGEGGYVVGPGSRHANGTDYQAVGDWTAPKSSLPVFDPAWVTLPSPSVPAADPTRTERSSRSTDVVMRAEAYLATIDRPEIGFGSDHAAFRMAAVLTRDFELDDATAEDILWNHVGNRPGWSREWVREKVRAARRYARRKEPGALRNTPLQARREVATATTQPEPVDVDAWEDGRDPIDPSRIGGATVPETDDPVIPPVEHTRAKFIPAMAVMSEEPPTFVVESVAVERGVTVIVGESGAGKSFVALNLAAAITEGVDWFGLQTELGSVAYVAFEADALNLRLRALRDSGRSLDNLYVLRASEALSPAIQRDGSETASLGEAVLTEQLAELTEHLRTEGRPPIRAIFIDTVRASMTGSEDNSEVVSAYLRVIRRLLRITALAAGFLVHHAGWQDGEMRRKRERGSSAFRGNADATLFVEVEEDNPIEHRVTLVVRTLKTRDAERPAPIRMIRQRVDVMGFDRRGNPLTSCVVVPDRLTARDREAKEAASQAAEDRLTAVEILKVIRDYPDATSRDRIRALVGKGKPVVDAGITRLLRDRHIVEGGRKEPFVINPSGTQLLSVGAV